MTEEMPTTAAGPACEKRVDGVLMSYPCELDRGHEANMGEPCYAQPVERSLRAWRRWRQDAEGREQCASGNHLWKAGFDLDTKALCLREGCSAVQEVAEAKGRPLADVFAADQAARYVRSLGLCGRTDEHLAICIRNRSHQDDCNYVPVGELPIIANERSCPADTDGDGNCGQANCPHCHPEVYATKQRPGDQVLPSGGQECVQDLVIAEMQESKRVGMERYGSVLRTFNGRRGIRDVAEEARDLHVYMAQIKREAEADRRTLVLAVLHNWGRNSDEGVFRGKPEDLAEMAVDAVMGWVVGQTMGAQRAVE